MLRFSQKGLDIMHIYDSLQSLALVLVVFGILFGSEDDLISYAFFGAAIILSVISLIMRRNKET